MPCVGRITIEQDQLSLGSTESKAKIRTEVLHGVQEALDKMR